MCLKAQLVSPVDPAVNVLGADALRSVNPAPRQSTQVCRLQKSERQWFLAWKMQPSSPRTEGQLSLGELSLWQWPDAAALPTAQARDCAASSSTPQREDGRPWPRRARAAHRVLEAMRRQRADQVDLISSVSRVQPGDHRAPGSRPIAAIR